MNTFVTIGYKKDGRPEILATPNVPYAKQKELFKSLEGNYSEVEIWSRSMGKIRGRKVREIKTKAKSKVKADPVQPENIKEKQ